MRHGPKIILQRAAKCGSRTLAARLAPELPIGMPGPTHVGLWAASHLPSDLLRITSVREPVAWHVSYFTHWLLAWRAGFDRVIEWMRPDLAAFARDLLDQHDAHPTHPDTVAILWAGYIEGALCPRDAAIDMDRNPAAMAWQVPPQDMPIRRWMDRTGMGLYSWAYVRSVLAREDWLLSAPALIGAARHRAIYGAALDCAQLDRALPILAAMYDLAIVDAPRVGKPETAPKITPTPDQIARIRAYERLSYDVHPWGDGMPAITWGDHS